MKANMIRKISTLIFVICLTITSISCKNNVDVSMYVSEYRSNIYEGENNGCKLTVYTERREDPYLLDGFVGNNKNFLTVKLESFSENADGVSVVISYDENSYNADFNFNPINGKFVAEILVDELPKSPTISAIVKESESENTITLNTKRFNDTKDYKEALNSVCNYDKEVVEKLFSSISVVAEVHIRLISDNEKNYYYVGFCDKEGKIYAYLVDGKDLKVIAKKV